MAQEAQNQSVTDQPVKDRVLAQIQALDEADKKKVIKTRARRTKIRSQFVGHTLAVFDGRDYRNVHITEEMVGKTLGKVVPRYSPTAQSRHVSIPPRKMRLVADMVIGRPVEDALNVLNFTPRIAARHIAKTIKAAVANKLSFEGTSHLNPEDLYVEKITVDAAPTHKRIRFQSMGRVFRIRKRHCHLAVYLDTRPHVEPELPATGKAKSGEEGAARKPKKRAAKKSTKKSAKKKSAKKAAKKTTKKAATKKAATKAKAGEKKQADAEQSDE
ncbi:50S ribosomal protein L22 [candidate division GN15 bacterium]|nr:50S ribosomal protein L22 [candidate division GN15 bacterium]